MNKKNKEKECCGKCLWEYSDGFITGCLNSHCECHNKMPKNKPQGKKYDVVGKKSKIMPPEYWVKQASEGRNMAECWQGIYTFLASRIKRIQVEHDKDCSDEQACCAGDIFKELFKEIGYDFPEKEWDGRVKAKF